MRPLAMTLRIKTSGATAPVAKPFTMKTTTKTA